MSYVAASVSQSNFSKAGAGLCHILGQKDPLLN